MLPAREPFNMAIALVALGLLFAQGFPADYPLGPDSKFQEGIAHGEVIKMPTWSSRVFTNTVRDWWVYVPAQYKESEPACLMVFQDGGGMVSTNGSYRVPVVFDNLIAKKEMPATIAVFVNPGEFPAAAAGERPKSNRSVEYDSLGGAYAKFLLEEIIPEISKKWKLSTKPEDHAICGNSSGGICSFTVAWERPDAFRKVVSHIGSFTNIRGGNVYPALVRKTERKPIRVFLQDGAADLDNPFGNWPIANQNMAAALKYAGYDYKFEFGEEAHNGKHGGSIFPDTLRWLWRDHKSN